MSLKERKAEAKQRVEQIMQACKAAGRVTLEKVIQNTRQPEPYRHPSKMTVTEVVFPAWHATVVKDIHPCIQRRFLIAHKVRCMVCMLVLAH